VIACDRREAAQTSDAVFSRLTNRRSCRPSAAEAAVTALSRMKPKRRSMLVCDF